jgi:transposase InsO family protein
MLKLLYIYILKIPPWINKFYCIVLYCIVLYCIVLYCIVLYWSGPLRYKLSKRDEGKCYIIIFTCATFRAVHLEVTESQSAEEFQRKLNAFVTRRTRPKRIVSDNASVFKSTATWIRKIRKSESLQDHLAKLEIRWQFNLSKFPWWGGMCERLIKEIKKTLYKTMGRSHLRYELNTKQDAL